MRVIADLHIHSKYSRATSQNMDIPTIAFYARIKGLNIVGTGDIFHPLWFKEVKEQLVETYEGSGIYALKDKPNYKTKFMITNEVSTVYEQDGKKRRIHHCLLLPSLDVAHQLIDTLSKYGNLESDGRPILQITSPELVEVVKDVCKEVEIYPAHAWTPWWSIYGANSGFNSIKECYQDKLHEIHALETGLSSDPPMNWRLSELDSISLLSNSDSHSPYPHRIGREANLFEIKELSYREIVDAIRKKDAKRLIFTIETKPEYGKYHWTGHRACNVSMPGDKAVKMGNICPKCKRRMTRGVEERVEELADRPKGYRPKNFPSYVYLLPLEELIATINGEKSLFTKSVQTIYNKLIAKFENEFNVSLFANLDDIKEVAGEEISIAVKAVREERIKVIPGYDGVYGQIQLPDELRGIRREGRKGRKKLKGTLEDFTY
jgi:uncharacterized protein (TIGR00375 family)